MMNQRHRRICEFLEAQSFRWMVAAHEAPDAFEADAHVIEDAHAFATRLREQAESDVELDEDTIEATVREIA